MRKKILYGYILFTQVGGGLGLAMLIAVFPIVSEFGWTNDEFMLSVYYAAMAVPFNTWLLKAFTDSIPPSYEEAAVIDGAPPWRVVWEIIPPLSKAGLAAVLIFVFLAGWMEFIVARTVLRPENYTLPVGLFALIDEYTVPWARFSAFALLFAAPVVTIYLFAQRYIESGRRGRFEVIARPSHGRWSRQTSNGWTSGPSSASRPARSSSVRQASSRN